jgi:transposase-like protein
MGSTRRKFIPEFKAEAAELSINSGKPLAKLPWNAESATGH